MTALRLSRWIVLVGALIGCIAWTYIAINHLLANSIQEQDRRGEYNSTSRLPSAHLHEMDLAQQHWGKVTMFAVACSFFFLLAVMMNWVQDGRRRQRPLGGELR